MWRYLTTSFISPLPGYVESKGWRRRNALSLHEIVLVVARFNMPRLLSAEIFVKGSRRKGQPL